MREKPPVRLEVARVQAPNYESPEGAMHGAFFARQRDMFILSSGTIDPEWEHVSVSLKNRCPTWEEMCLVKDLFWGEDETVIQFHPKDAEHVNNHPYCLHLWKRTGEEHELPPALMVGVIGMEPPADE